MTNTSYTRRGYSSTASRHAHQTHRESSTLYAYSPPPSDPEEEPSPMRPPPPPTHHTHASRRAASFSFGISATSGGSCGGGGAGTAPPPAPILFHFEVDPSDIESSDSEDIDFENENDLRPSHSEPIQATNQHNHNHRRPLRHQQAFTPPPPSATSTTTKKHKNKQANTNTNTGTKPAPSLTCLERESLLERVRQLSASEADAMATSARLSSENVALVQELTHWKQAAHDANASRRAAREALSDVSTENARLAAAYSAQRLEAAGLKETVRNQRIQLAEMEEALRCAYENIQWLQHQGGYGNGNERTTASATGRNGASPPPAPSQPPSHHRHPSSSRHKKSATNDWDREKKDLLELLERLQEQLSRQHTRTSPGTYYAHSHPSPSPPPTNNTSNTTPTSPPCSPPLHSTFTMPTTPLSPSPLGSDKQHQQHQHQRNPAATPNMYYTQTPRMNNEYPVQWEASNENVCTAMPTTTPPLSSSRPSSGDSRAAMTPPPHQYPTTAAATTPDEEKEREKDEIAAVKERNNKMAMMVECKGAGDRSLAKKRYEEAYAQYSKALTQAEELQDDNACMNLFICRATVLKSSGRYLESAGDCCRAITLGGGSSAQSGRAALVKNAFDVRAEAYFMMGAYDLAVEDLAKLDHTPAVAARMNDARTAVADSIPRNHYAVLGVKPSANSSEIKSAYKSLALLVHPDKSADSLGRERATALFSLLAAAHSALGSTQNRRGYDLQILRHKYSKQWAMNKK